MREGNPPGPRPIGDLAATSRARRASALMEDHQGALRAATRRISVNAADAEDALQRTAEILLRKGPEISERELLAWARVVARNEALAVRRERRRTPVDPARPPGASGFDPDSLMSPTTGPAAATEARERVAAASRALRDLKPQERRAIALQAAGCSYAEIQAITGWTHTKVNRCLAEGRAALRERRCAA